MQKRLTMRRKNRGFTLIEVVMALAITALIGGGVTTAVGQVMLVTNRSANHMAAVNDVQNALHWIERDVEMAQTVTPGAAAGFPLDLTWTDWNNAVHHVTYRIDAGRLVRSLSINGGPAKETTVGVHISDDEQKTNTTYRNGVVTIEITSSVGAGTRALSEARAVQTMPRPSL